MIVFVIMHHTLIDVWMPERYCTLCLMGYIGLRKKTQIYLSFFLYLFLSLNAFIFSNSKHWMIVFVIVHHTLIDVWIPEH
jgi:hypothetical protein